MTTPEIAALAAVAMAIQDVLSVCMVQAEARDRGWLAGWLDSAGWLAGITTTSLSVTALQGHHLVLKVTVILAVSVANLLGSKLGQVIGTRYIHPAAEPWQERLEALERAVFSGGRP